MLNEGELAAQVIFGMTLPEEAREKALENFQRQRNVERQLRLDRLNHSKQKILAKWPIVEAQLTATFVEQIGLGLGSDIGQIPVGSHTYRGNYEYVINGKTHSATYKSASTNLPPIIHVRYRPKAPQQHEVIGPGV